MKLLEKRNIIFKIILSIIVILSIFTFGSLCYGCEQTIESVEKEINIPYTRDEVNANIIYYRQRIQYAEDMATAARALGYAEDHLVICTAFQEIEAANVSLRYFFDLENYYYQEDLKWENKKQEYPIATTVWLYLKDLGYNDYVCAGILGNMMAECGGGTLNLYYDIVSYDHCFYGLCQWSKLHNEVWNKDLNGQLDYLKDTIQYEIDTFGYAYKKDFKYNDFLELADERKAAFVFAVCYERCAKQHRAIRQDYAEIAYSYFAGDLNE